MPNNKHQIEQRAYKTNLTIWLLVRKKKRDKDYSLVSKIAFEIRLLSNRNVSSSFSELKGCTFFPLHGSVSRI